MGDERKTGLDRTVELVVPMAEAPAWLGVLSLRRSIGKCYAANHERAAALERLDECALLLTRCTAREEQ